MVSFRVEQLLNLEDTEGDVVQLHLDRHEHDLSKTPPTAAAKHVERLLDIHLGMLWALAKPEFKSLLRVFGCRLSCDKP